jgi:hypothetical protein
MSKNPKERKLAHGQTEESLDELRLAQIDGNVKKVDTNVSTNDYRIPEHEKHLVHAEVSIPQFNQTTGADESVKRVQTFTEREFKSTEETGGFSGMKVNILHDPRRNSGLQNIDPADALRAKVVSAGDGGLPLDESLDSKSDSDLKAIYNDLYKGDAIEGLDRPKLLIAIRERVAFLKEERVQATRESEAGRAAATGAPSNTTQIIEPAATAQASAGANVDPKKPTVPVDKNTAPAGAAGASNVGKGADDSKK